MIRVFQIDVWFATLAHALKVKCGSVLTPVLRTLIVAANGGAIFIAVSLAMLAFRGTRKAGCAALIALAASVLLTEVFLLSKRYIVAFFLYSPCNGLFEGVQDERNFIGEAAAQIISQEKDLILFGYDYWDEDAGRRCEMQPEDMATSIRDRLPLKDRDHSVFPFRRR